MKRVRLTEPYERRARNPDERPVPGEYRSAAFYGAGELVTFADDEADRLIAAGKAVEE
jgi:hypothetical protein